METAIKISALSAIYEAGARKFVEPFLKSKAERGESVVYSVGGRIVKLKADEALRIYYEITNGMSQEEIDRIAKDEGGIQGFFDRIEKR